MNTLTKYERVPGSEVKDWKKRRLAELLLQWIWEAKGALESALRSRSSNKGVGENESGQASKPVKPAIKGITHCQEETLRIVRAHMVRELYQRLLAKELAYEIVRRARMDKSILGNIDPRHGVPVYAESMQISRICQ